MVGNGVSRIGGWGWQSPGPVNPPSLLTKVQNAEHRTSLAVVYGTRASDQPGQKLLANFLSKKHLAFIV